MVPYADLDPTICFYGVWVGRVVRDGDLNLQVLQGTLHRNGEIRVAHGGTDQRASETVELLDDLQGFEHVFLNDGS